MDSLRMPSDADLMKIAVADLQNSSSPDKNRQRALQELLELVEPIDNANGMATRKLKLVIQLVFSVDSL